ncbi:MAG: cell division protein ZapD [Gammaproteobacteria bacterium]
MDNLITYEQPLNERIRTLMRLEHLFQQAAYTLRGYSVWDSRATLASLIDIMDILGRVDLKTELFKELERLQAALAKVSGKAGVDEEQLQSILNQLEKAQTGLQQTSGQLGQALKEEELISNLRQRSSLAGGNCHFDLPNYHFWLQQPPEVRIDILEGWFEQLATVQQAVTLVLGIIRESNVPRTVVAEQGFYQQNLDTQFPHQLIRISIDSELPYFAEISAGKHRLTIRFLEPRSKARPLQAEQDVRFQLTCCAI